MELILLKDVENLGFRDDVVTVKNGYGRNFLIPQKMAILASSSAKKNLEETLRQKAFKESKIIEEVTKKAESIKSLELKLIVKSNDGTKLFGSVNNSNVSDLLEKKGFLVDKKFIKVVGGTIKNVGKYTATIRMHRSVVFDITFDVVADVQKLPSKKPSKPATPKKEESKEQNDSLQQS